MATVPTLPTAPRPLLIVTLSAILGGLLGVGLAFGVEHLSFGMRTRHDVERILDLPLLAQVPQVRGVSTLSNRAVEHPLSGYAEAIRTIQMAIRYAVSAGTSNVILFTSALPGEGKSTTSLNLAQMSRSRGSDSFNRRRYASSHDFGAACPGVFTGLAQVLRSRSHGRMR